MPNVDSGSEGDDQSPDVFDLHFLSDREPSRVDGVGLVPESIGYSVHFDLEHDGFGNRDLAGTRKTAALACRVLRVNAR